MPYISPEVILEAKQIDLLTYLKACEPSQLVRVSGNTYCTKEHDSLKISNENGGCGAEVSGAKLLSTIS